MADEAHVSPAAARNWGRVRRLLITPLLLLLGGWLLVSLTRHEISQWRLAASYEEELRGNLVSARSQLDSAIRWTPHHSDLYTKRAHAMISLGDAEAALPDCDRAVELARQEHPGSLAIALNQRAYAYALCDRHLDEALENIEEAIQTVGGNESFLDTRGYIYLRLDQLQKAQADIEAAVQLAEANYKKIRNEYRSQLRSAIDTRPVQRLIKQLDEMFAVLYHHRGELYEALGRTNEAASDLARAARLGYDPQRGVW